jgi:transitional endoplasmic reticulum ATPase
MSFRARKSRKIELPVIQLEPIVELWILRVMIPLEGHRNFITTIGLDSDELASCFGLSSYPENESEDEHYTQEKYRLLLKQRYHAVEKKAGGIDFPDLLNQNLKVLAKQIGLNEIERSILGFAIIMRSHRLLDDTLDWLGMDLNTLKVIHILSVILGIPERDVRLALNSKSALSQTGLVTIDRRHRNSLSRKLDVLSSSFCDRLMTESGSPFDWLRDMIAPSPLPELQLSDYPHIKETLDSLLPYLRHITSYRRKGVNFLIHGAPGTGKTQLVRALAAALNFSLYEIACEDEDGDPLVGEQRLRAHGVAQQFLHNSVAMVLFDEAEDVFTNGHFLRDSQSPAQRRKAWMNRMLEKNPCPTFWLTNSIEAIDPAFIRRFDWIINVPVPPKSQREQIIRNKCGQLLDEKSVKKLATYETLAPAVIDRVSNVVNCIRGELPADKLSTTLTGMIHNTLIAQGHREYRTKEALELPQFYDPEFIHCDADIVQIVSGVKNASARICLYGPPGTGKTAYSHWLAEQLGKPLHVKRGSDLFSKWVGETESNIAQIFEIAEEEDAVLLIDEVDSFLMDRKDSRNSWEITGVNEMLSRMEEFKGVFVASTNRLECLDSAALRRFDLKIEFNTLRPEQAWKLFQTVCQTINIRRPKNNLKSELNKIEGLTPGDFALVVRQHRLRPIHEAKSFLERLLAECALKNPYHRKPIGFVS